MNTTLSTHPDIQIGRTPSDARARPIATSSLPPTAIGRATLAGWIRHHPSCSDAALRHVVGGLVAACLDLQRSTGRSHGALTAGRIVLGETAPRRLTQARVQLAGPRALEVASPEAVELADLRAIGLVILQMVEGHLVDEDHPGARAMRMGEAWRGLGPQADFWFLLCHQLLDTDLSLATMSLATLAVEFPARRRQPGSVAFALASCALALASTALYVAQPDESGPAPRAAAAGGRPDEVRFIAAARPDALDEPAATPPPAPPLQSPSDSVTTPVATPAAAPLFVTVALEAQPGSLASLVGTHGTFTSLGIVDPHGRLTRDMALPAGTYELTLEHRDFAPARSTVDLRPGERIVVQPPQAPLPGALRITSTPAGAEVRIDGLVVGHTPLALKGQPSRREIAVEASMPGHEPAARVLTLAPCEIRALDFGALTPRPASEPAVPAPVAVVARSGVAPATEPVFAPVEVPSETIPAHAPSVSVVSTVDLNDADGGAVPRKPFAGPRPGSAWTVPDLGIALQWIGPGHFLMGSPINEQGRQSGEAPQTAVHVDAGYWIARFEVSQAQFAGVMGANPSAFRRTPPEAPVEQVSWDEAMDFCRQLTDRERRAGRLPAGFAYTLPTETQWEYACRAGTTSPWPGPPELMAWFEKNSRRQTRAPGERLPVADPHGTVDSGPSRFIPRFCEPQPNNWGLHDMIGNVGEWCRRRPDAFEDEATAVVRGGSWRSTLAGLRSAAREETPRETRRSDIGFRVVLAAE